MAATFSRPTWADFDATAAIDGHLNRERVRQGAPLGHRGGEGAAVANRLAVYRLGGGGAQLALQCSLSIDVE